MVEQDGTRLPTQVMEPESFAQRALDKLLPHADQLTSRRAVSGMEGMLMAATIRHRDELAGISAVDSFLIQALPLLSLTGMYTGLSRRETIERVATNISQLRQQWNSLLSTDTLAPVVIRDRIEHLPEQIGRRRFSPLDKSNIQRRFQILTAPQSPR